MQTVTQATGKKRQQGGKPHAKPKKQKKTCGARTRTCVTCGHHRREHAGGLARCHDCEKKCEEFIAKPCAADKLLPNGRCRMHGGKSGKGIAAGTWKHGRWAHGLQNKALQDGFYAALSDPTLLKLQQEAALVDGLLVEFMKRLPAKKAVSSSARREILRLTAEHRAIVAEAGRMERHLGMFIPRAQFGHFVSLVVGLFREFVKGSDGEPDLKALTEIRQRLEAGAASVMITDVHDGEVVEDGE